MVPAMTLLSFLMVPWIAGVGLSVIISNVGCFIVWRRLSFFGDALAHSALLGVALGLILNIPLFWGVLIICLLSAVILTLTANQPSLASDTSLAIVSYGSLALGILAVSKLAVRVDPASYLFGDILTVTWYDVMGVFGVAILVVLFFYHHWQRLLLMTLHFELAQAEGLQVQNLQLQLTLVLALTVAACLKFIGVLLVPALLVIPPATAARYATTPESMAWITFLLALISITVGLFLSVILNIASGASIVITALCLFIISQLNPSKVY